MTALFVIVFLLSFLAMELVAWLSHRYLMHGPLWFIHKDHHQPLAGKTFQKNDLFFILFATPGIALIYLGMSGPTAKLYLAAGLGITCYGVAYFFVHEIFIHRRIPLVKRSGIAYFDALKSAHARHHKCLEREGAECFGMLIVPYRFLKIARRRLKTKSVP